MKLDDKLKKLIEKLKSESMNEFIDALDGSNFGLYLPTYADGDTVKPMLEGYSQTEKDLVVSISKNDDDEIIDAKPVAWMGGKFDKDTTCTHGGTKSCKHCTGHTGACKHCSKHSSSKFGVDFDAPRLDYDLEIEKLINKRELLEKLAVEGFGLTLLHGHNNKHMFTKLPEGYVTVISNGETTFRTEEELKNDASFVPNMWRSINGELKIAGGYSSM